MKIKTHHLDKLATPGMAFTDAHGGCSACSPTLSGGLTDRHAWRTSLQQGFLPFLERFDLEGLTGKTVQQQTDKQAKKP